MKRDKARKIQRAYRAQTIEFLSSYNYLTFQIAGGCYLWKVIQDKCYWTFMKDSGQMILHE